MFCKSEIEQKTFTKLSLVPYLWYYRLIQAIGDQDLASTFLKEVFEYLTDTSEISQNQQAMEYLGRFKQASSVSS